MNARIDLKMALELVLFSSESFWLELRRCKYISLLSRVCRDWRCHLKKDVHEIVRMMHPAVRMKKAELIRLLALNARDMTGMRSPILLHVALHIAENKRGGILRGMTLREKRFRRERQAGLGIIFFVASVFVAASIRLIQNSCYA